ncbi:MAG: hypothetical protein KGJ34_00610 [Patescibacteria group bacterium]|nr:hypothetical protein [Patescibacteria group bacterium]
MVVQSWLTVLQDSFVNLFYGVVNFIPAFLFAVIIFIIGWIVGVVLGRVVAQVIQALKVDHALKAAGVDDIVSRAGYTLNSGAFLGFLVRWFIIIVFLLAALEVMGLTQVTLFLDQVVLFYLPQVIVAALILLFGAVLAEAVQNVVTGSARAAGIVSAGFVGAVARWLIWIIAILAALSQLGIASGILQTLFTGIVVALSLGFGLAFGLGGQDAAARFLERMRSQMNHGK